MSVPTATLDIDHLGTEYLGVVLRQGGIQISRHFSADWVTDYKRAMAEGKRRVGGGGVVTVTDSAFVFMSMMSHHERTSRTPKKSIVPKELGELPEGEIGEIEPIEDESND